MKLSIKSGHTNFVYYAHSKQIYGTPEEKIVRDFLREKFPGLICPNEDLQDNPNMEYYLNWIKRCDEVVVTEFLNHIGCGVFEIIKYALSNQIPVHVLRFKKGKPKFYRILDCVKVAENDIAIFYGHILILPKPCSI